ncbi:MAG: DNA-directed DNA polymerase I, partial [Promethearchaeota archaeon]
MDFSETTLDQFFESYEPRKKTEKSSKDEKITEIETKKLSTKKKDFLLSVEYDGKNSCAAARFYDPKNHSIYFWHDCSDHHPYCLSNISIEDLKNNSKITNHTGFLDMETVEKKDLLLDKSIKMTKIIAKDPLAIGGKTGAIRELLPTAWEANIPYHKCYIADLELTPGLPYEVFDEQLNSAAIVPAEIREEISQLFQNEAKEVKELLEENVPLFLSPIPDIKRAAIDIEVISPFADAIPRPEQANYPVGCISIVASDGEKRMLLLERKDVEIGDAKENLEDVSIEYFSKEKELFQKIFQIFKEYPVILTYNGDKFDMPYLYYRALNHLGFRRDEIPLIIRKDFVALSKNIHVDLYRFFNNRAVQIYAFSAKYKTTDLNTVAKALLGIEKIKVEQPLSKLPLLDLASYCYRDGKITLDLTRYSENLVWKLIMLLMRISHLSLEDVTRQSVSSWIQNLFFYEHRKNDYLIPLPNDIKEAKGGEASTQAIIKGKKYKGAIVIDPLPGVHFDVVVLDFASLYPSIIKVHNLSYETVRCTHPECKQNIIPDTDHWVCKKQRGLAGLIIGFLRDIRLKWFKPQSKNKMLAKETRELYYVIQQALKLIINAFYGVFGADHFPLYCLPVAESTTALGRFIITQTIERAQKMGISVIYGDTDSVFLENPSESQIENLTQWCKQTLDIDLDIDKIYRYVALSGRKKNYLGVY